MSPGRLEIASLVLRLRRPLVTARGEYVVRTGFTVALHLGIWVGRGEAMPLAEFGTESLAETEVVLHELATRAPGWSVPSSAEDVRQLLRTEGTLADHPAARHAIECALLDVAAQASGVSVARLINRAARTSVRVNALLSSVDPAMLAEEGVRARDAGFEVVKVKVGGRSLDFDLARLHTLRAALDAGPPSRQPSSLPEERDPLSPGRERVRVREKLDIETSTHPDAPPILLGASSEGRGHDRLAASEARVLRRPNPLPLAGEGIPLLQEGEGKRREGQVAIRIDANGSWGDDSLANLAQLHGLGIELCEQPVPSGDIAGLRALHGRSPIPIAADEAVSSLESGLLLLGGAEPASDLLALRPMVLGGILGAFDLSRAAAERGVGTFVVSSLDGVLARAASIHLAAALPDARWASGLGVGELFEGDDPTGLLAIHDGRIEVPAGPGLLPGYAP